jgi:beta-lactamase class C
MKSFLLVLCFLVALSSLAYGDDCSAIHDQVRKVMARNQITGVAIAIVNQNKIEFCNHGHANKDRKVPITEKSIFEIASITKTFTALLAGIAVVENKLNLRAPISKYVPELSSNSNYLKINIQQLLGHVAGLPLIFEMKSFSEDELIHSLVNMSFSKLPADYYQYSNPGIALSGLAMTRIYGKSFQSLLDALILSKLDMSYTSIHVNYEHQPWFVTGYNKDDHPVDFINLGIDNPAGGLKSNTYDLARYLQLQINGQDLKLKKALAVVHKNYYCLDEAGTYQQLAWEYHPPHELYREFLPDSENRNILPSHKLPNNCENVPNGFIDKTGNFPGTTSYIGYIPNKNGVVILSNRSKTPDIVNLGRYILQKTKDSVN